MQDIKQYIKKIGEIPSFLEKYLSLPSLQRLKKVGYFCGMDYASKEVYDFSFAISRYDHSLTTALLTWRYSKDKASTIAALFHDIATPCFSHVIDYMNGDYVVQESTEEKTEEILKQEKSLISLLKQDGLVFNDVVPFKKYPVVDNQRPKLCADRLDGIILTSLAWTKELSMNEVDEILTHLALFTNEEEELEIGFTSENVAKKVICLNEKINIYCHSNDDTFMMMLLSRITKYLIDKKIICYDDLYTMNEEELINKCNLYAKKDDYFWYLLNQFYFIKLKEITIVSPIELKERVIYPLIQGERYE